ncbi:SDR family oxidoreductase [Xanthomonas euroxanthea]|uniref:SDR family oxidoreductase n=1 Tax=Xanthomonas euroxanthea TaxID=2259622 RepID=A0A8E4DWM3_9XANT|nr:SDR family oxidoreductase [Xanthomonas euroxanthea]
MRVLDPSNGRVVLRICCALFRGSLGRIGLPDAIARTILLLASDLVTYVTGVMVPVDGGDLAR